MQDAELISYAPDMSTCTLRVGDEQLLFNRHIEQQAQPVAIVEATSDAARFGIGLIRVSENGVLERIDPCEPIYHESRSQLMMVAEAAWEATYAAWSNSKHTVEAEEMAMRSVDLAAIVDAIQPQAEQPAPVNQHLLAALKDCVEDSRELLCEYEQKYGPTYKQHRIEYQRKVVAAAETAIAAAESAQAQQPADGVVLDAERYRFLRNRMLGVDFDWCESGVTALAFEMPDGCAYGADCDKNIDAALAAHKAQKGQS